MYYVLRLISSLASTYYQSASNSSLMRRVILAYTLPVAHHLELPLTG